MSDDDRAAFDLVDAVTGAALLVALVFGLVLVVAGRCT